jgi:surfeit locus 1 family protein
MSRTRVLAAFVAAALGIVLTVSLGNWQLRRAAEKLALQARWEAAESKTAVRLEAAALTALEHRLPARVRARGIFLHEFSVWLDNRMLDGRAGFWVVTPLRIEGGGVVLVNRGWAPRDLHDRARLPAIGQPQAVAEIEGLAVTHAPRLLELGKTPTAALPGVFQNLEYTAFEQASGLRVARLVVQQTSDLDDGLVRRWSRPDTGVDKHRGYALQWYSLAALIATLVAVFGVRGWRRRTLAPMRCA